MNVEEKLVGEISGQLIGAEKEALYTYDYPDECFKRLTPFVLETLRARARYSSSDKNPDLSPVAVKMHQVSRGLSTFRRD